MPERSRLAPGSFARLIPHQVLWSSGTDRTPSGGYGPIDFLTDSLKFVFSWIALTPISIIVSGRLLSQLLKLSGRRKQLFQVKIPGVIHVGAQGDEVILGFALFIVTIMAIAILSGDGAYKLFKRDFGLDLGQFNSICVLSAFSTVVVAVTLLLLTRLLGAIRHRTDSVAAERDQLIQRLSKDKRPGGGE